MGKRGFPPVDLDWEQVKRLCAIQCTRDEIASYFGISHDTLQRACLRDHKRHFCDLRAEWAEGGKCSLRRKQWMLADKNAAMAIFLGKQMLGQKDDYKNFHSGTITQEIVHYGDKPTGPWKAEEQDKDSSV